MSVFASRLWCTSSTCLYRMHSYSQNVRRITKWVKDSHFRKIPLFRPQRSTSTGPVNFCQQGKNASPKNVGDGGLKGAASEATGQSTETVAKPSLMARFKAMYRDYYYVLIPVHVVTSLGWFGAFYHTSQR
jgi:hypothetical protein